MTNEQLEALREMAEQWRAHKAKEQPCPSCGHCPTCGRSAAPWYHINPWYQRPWHETYPHITWISSGTNGTGGTYTTAGPVVLGNTVTLKGQ